MEGLSGMSAIVSLSRSVLRRPRYNVTKLTARLPASERDWAATLANSFGSSEVFAELRYTEQRIDLILLRRHASRGQISPEIMRRMRTVDLEYLAGMPEVNPTMPEDAKASEVKIVENAIRATRVLEHRAQFWATSWATVGGSAAGGALIGLFALLVS